MDYVSYKVFLINDNACTELKISTGLATKLHSTVKARRRETEGGPGGGRGGEGAHCCELRDKDHELQEGSKGGRSLAGRAKERVPKAIPLPSLWICLDFLLLVHLRPPSPAPLREDF